MYLDHYELFKTLASTRNITKAAELCNISQPAASIKIKKMEDHYGTRFFTRENKEFILTKEGKLFLELSEKMLSADYNFRLVLNCVKENQNEVLKFGATTGPANYILPELISKFHSEYKNIYIKMEVNERDVILEEVKNNHLAFGFVGSKGRKDLVYDEIMHDRIILCSNGDKKWPKLIHSRDLYELDMFFEQESSSSRKFLTLWLEENGIDVIKMRSVGEVGLPDALKRIIQHGEGVAFLPETLINDELTSGTLEEIKIKDFPPIVRSLYIAKHPDYNLNKWAQLFITSYLKKI